ncbi:granulocyte-macrophage colony-stimulating factor receptor subunit alpha [Columba guinea]|nr:granulocyte-macrophage colony-stimulating factor receptor subunit alpha [Columba guinea]
MNGTAIENFVCVIFNVSFMNCTWHVGRTASGDTQYFLYWKNSKKENFTGCQNYIKDNHGRHTGCRFQNVTIENKRAHFLVNGSQSGQNIQTYEKMIFLYEIGKGQVTSASSYTLFVIPVLVASLILFLCTVRIYLKRTSAKVPQPRNPFHGHSSMDFQIEYKNILIKDEPEDIITIIEEVA